MMRRVLLSLSVIGVITGFVVTPAASAQQSINVFVGGFVPDGYNSRGTNDVLFQDFNGSAVPGQTGALNFNLRDFNGPTAGVEYLVGLNDFFDAGLGVGIYSRSATAYNAGFVEPTTGGNIYSTLGLRVVPFTATFRYLPLGHHDAFVPYIGAGVGIFAWRYTESGSFADSSGNLYNEPPGGVASGTAVFRVSALSFRFFASQLLAGLDIAVFLYNNWT